MSTQALATLAKHQMTIHCPGFTPPSRIYSPQKCYLQENLHQLYLIHLNPPRLLLNSSNPESFSLFLGSIQFYLLLYYLPHPQKISLSLLKLAPNSPSLHPILIFKLHFFRSLKLMAAYQ